MVGQYDDPKREPDRSGSRGGQPDGAFPDGNSAINLAAARLRHIDGTRWSTKRYLNMQLLRQRNAMIA
jgi:hypothetical protein